jgi:nitrogen regulatory protein P-II 1
MKRLEAVVRRERVPRVMAALEEAGFARATVQDVYGHGNQRGVQAVWRGRKFHVEWVPKALIILVVEDMQAENAIDAICAAAATGQVGDGKIFVTTLDDAIRIVTGSRGTLAL